MFQLTLDEAQTIHRVRSQFVTLKRGQHLKYLHYAFTEHGAIMAANVLRSRRAIQMSVFVIRAFVKMRSTLNDTRELAQKLAAIERELKGRMAASKARNRDSISRRRGPYRFKKGPHDHELEFES